MDGPAPRYAVSALSTKNDVDTRKQKFHLRPRELSHALRKQRPVEGHDL